MLVTIAETNASASPAQCSGICRPYPPAPGPTRPWVAPRRTARPHDRWTGAFRRMAERPPGPPCCAAALPRMPARVRRDQDPVGLALAVLGSWLATRGHQDLAVRGHQLVVMVVDGDWLARYVTEVRHGFQLLRRVGDFAVHLDVTRDQLGLAHPQLHEQADSAQDQERDQPVPDDDGQGRPRLDQQLPRMAVEQAGRAHIGVLADAKVDDHLRVGQQPDEQAAEQASAPAKYGSPPLKPFQPSQRMPAPTATKSRLLGIARARSRRSRGPTTAAATKPETPAAR